MGLEPLKKQGNRTTALEFINTAWPVAVGFITLVIVLAKMHNDIETLKEKVRVIFELWNSRGK